MGRTPYCDADGLKKGLWTPEEDQKLLTYIQQHGHRCWRSLAEKAGLQRCGKSCRLRWNNYLKPGIKRGSFSLQEDKTIIQLHALLGNKWSAITAHLPNRTDNEVKNYWNTHLKKRLAMMGIDPVTHKPTSTILGSANGDPKIALNLSHMAQWESARLQAEARLAKESQLRQHEPGDTTNTLAPPRCLDVVKTWQSLMLNSIQGGLHNGSFGLGLGDNGGDLESPTSTLSFSKSAQAAVSTVLSSSDFNGVLGADHMNEVHATQQHNMALDVGDVPSTIQASDNGDGNFIEGIANNLLFNNLDMHSLSTFSTITSTTSTGNGEVHEMTKNYWNNILNLIN
ncbi:hypothetical protein ACB092_04G137200 [Castanea dentata]